MAPLLFIPVVIGVRLINSRSAPAARDWAGESGESGKEWS